MTLFTNEPLGGRVDDAPALVLVLLQVLVQVLVLVASVLSLSATSLAIHDSTREAIAVSTSLAAVADTVSAPPTAAACETHSPTMSATRETFRKAEHHNKIANARDDKHTMNDVQFIADSLTGCDVAPRTNTVADDNKHPKPSLACMRARARL